MLLYFTLIACAATFGWQVYRYDLKDREPVPALILAAALGAVGMWLAGLAQVAIMRNMGSLAADHWNTTMSIIAGLTEETAKLTAVVLVIGLRPRWFNDPLDGLVYGAFAGLGAALQESVFLLAGQSNHFLPATEPVRLAGHLLMGGIGAFGLAYMKLGRRGWQGRLVAGFVAALALHATWDIVAFDATDRGSLSLPHTIASMIVMFGGMVIFRAMIKLAAGEKRGSGGRKRRGFTLELEPVRVERRRATDPAAA
jgi:RsiW-degrading membrane proteinase PrsW (M82 family)